MTSDRRLLANPRMRRSLWIAFLLAPATIVMVTFVIWPLVSALRLSFDVVFDTTLWSVVPVVALVALGAALVWGDRRLAAYLAALLGLVFLGGAWATYAFRELPITAQESANPIVRYTGAVVLLSAVATPLLLASVWRSGTERPR